MNNVTILIEHVRNWMSFELRWYCPYNRAGRARTRNKGRRGMNISITLSLSLSLCPPSPPLPGRPNFTVKQPKTANFLQHNQLNPFSILQRWKCIGSDRYQKQSYFVSNIPYMSGNVVTMNIESICFAQVDVFRNYCHNLGKLRPFRVAANLACKGRQGRRS